MRIANIFCNNDQKYRNNCVNIDISSQSKRDDIINILPSAINDFFESEEFDSIIINDCINFFNTENQIDFLKTLTTKLCKNGIMTISFHDVEEISRKFLNSKIKINELNQILFMQNNVNKMSVSTLESVSQILSSNGFILNKVNFSDTLCSIEGIKK